MGEARDSTSFFDQFAAGFVKEYDDRSPMFVERIQVWSTHIRRHLQSLNDTAVCVDLGCGEGVLTRLVAACGYHCVGFDQSEAMLQLARERTRDQSIVARTEYQLGRLPIRAPHLDAKVDLLLCSSVLEYVEDTDSVIASFHRLLKPRGIALVSLPNARARYRRYERWRFRVWPHRESYLNWQVHQCTAEEGRRMFERHGLRCFDVEYYGLPPTPALFGGRNGPGVSTMLLFSLTKDV